MIGWRGHNLNGPPRNFYQRSYGYDPTFTPPKPKERRIVIMAKVVWCDQDDNLTNVIGQVGHPFSDQDANMQQITWSRKVRNEYGSFDTVDTVKTLCGYHWELENPFHTVEDAKEIQNGKHEKAA